MTRRQAKIALLIASACCFVLGLVLITVIPLAPKPLIAPMVILAVVAGFATYICQMQAWIGFSDVKMTKPEPKPPEETEQ